MAVTTGDDLFLSTPSARRATPVRMRPAQPVCNFYPRPPRGGRLMIDPSGVVHVTISIHALREEGDAAETMLTNGCVIFLSTPSARRATSAGILFPGSRRFLSTPSARRATPLLYVCAQRLAISIHALREEGDWSTERWQKRWSNFYPRPPRGGRPPKRGRGRPPLTISIHALREEGDSKNRDKISIFKQIIQHSARI